MSCTTAIAWRMKTPARRARFHTSYVPDGQIFLAKRQRLSKIRQKITEVSTKKCGNTEPACSMHSRGHEGSAVRLGEVVALGSQKHSTSATWLDLKDGWLRYLERPCSVTLMLACPCVSARDRMDMREGQETSSFERIFRMMQLPRGRILSTARFEQSSFDSQRVDHRCSRRSCHSGSSYF